MNDSKIICSFLIQDLLADKPFIRFLFDRNKLMFEMFVTEYPSKNDIKNLGKLLRHIYKKFNFKIHFYWSCEKLDDEYLLSFFKTDLKFGDRNYHLKHGLYFNIPKCCLEKYLKEQKGSKLVSYNSVKRYLKQCQDMKIKDDFFNIKLLHNGADCSKYGFVPCSPKCKEALRIAKITDNLQSRLIDSFKY